jgi:hypothetical protein
MAAKRNSPVGAYLHALEDLLPPGDVARVLPEVEAMILDRVDAERANRPDADQQAIETAALTGWKSPEQLCEELVSAPLTVDWVTRRAFIRNWLVLFAAHLVISIVLTAANSTASPVPGLLGPLPSSPWTATVLSLLAILLMDGGAILVLFLLTHGRRTALKLPRVALGSKWTRRGAIEGLVLITLLAIIVNLLRDSIFALRTGDRLDSFLSPAVANGVPFINAVLGLFALRHIVTLWRGGADLVPHAVEALACVAAIILIVLAATHADLIEFPPDSMGAEMATILNNVVERVFRVVLIIGALLIGIRLVKVLMRVGRIVAAQRAS